MTRRPLAPQHEFHRALKAAERARRQGDHKACAHWMKLADQSLKLAERLMKLAMLQRRDEEIRECHALAIEELTDLRVEEWSRRRAQRAGVDKTD